MAFIGPLEDRLALRELLEAYADAVCRRDAAAWAATWGDQAAWDLGEFGQFAGKPAIVAAWMSAMDGFPGILFQAWPGAMEISGCSATMRSYTSECYVRDGLNHRDLGEYDDLCVKIAGQWLFVQRGFRSLHRQQFLQ